MGLSGKADNVWFHSIDARWINDGLLTLSHSQVVSTLSVLEPFRRAVVGVPFLYQKVRAYLLVE